MENLKVLENGLIPVYENEKGSKLVNARELHNFLGVRKDFTSWIKDRITKYDFKENGDYSTFTEIVEREIGATRKTEYILTLDTAKEIAMVQNNARGRDVRKYFIAIENKFKEVAKPMSIEDLIMLQAQSVKDLKTKVEHIGNITATLEHRVNNLDCSNLTGTPRQQLNALIKKYAYTNGISYAAAYNEFYSKFNTAFHSNLKLNLHHYKVKNHIKNLTVPEYMERVDKITDGLRIASKMISGVN